jgi:predicted nucleic acid-binding protein
MNVLVDTNVLLDVLLERGEFQDPAAKIWSLAEQGRVRGFIAAINYSNVFYIITKAYGVSKGHLAARTLRKVFTMVPLDLQIVDQAMDSGIADLEDAIQFYSALRAEAVCIVTRNPDHYPKAELPVYTPTEFLAAHFSE